MWFLSDYPKFWAQDKKYLTPMDSATLNVAHRQSPLSLLGGRHSTAVALKLRAPEARVRISAFPRFFLILDVAELIDSKDSALKAL